MTLAARNIGNATGIGPQVVVTGEMSQSAEVLGLRLANLSLVDSATPGSHMFEVGCEPAQDATADGCKLLSSWWDQCRSRSYNQDTEIFAGLHIRCEACDTRLTEENLRDRSFRICSVGTGDSRR
jgi:hypothetical protein